MRLRVYLPLALTVLSLAMNGCSRDKDDKTKAENTTSSTSVGDLVPKLGEPAEQKEISVIDVTPRPTSPPPADVSPETLEKVGKLLDESSNIMQDLALTFSAINDLQAATEAAPKITEKVALLTAINKESVALGVNPDLGEKQFPDKYQVLKQTSLLIQGHMKRIYLDAPTFQMVTDAWKKGQETVAEPPGKSQDGAKSGSTASVGETTASPATAPEGVVPPSAAPHARSRLRDYQPGPPGTPPVLVRKPTVPAAPPTATDGAAPQSSQTPSPASGGQEGTAPAQ